MFARFVCVFACFVLAHSLPAKQPTPEELGVGTTVISSNLKDEDYEELLKGLVKEDAATGVLLEETSKDKIDDESVTKDYQSGNVIAGDETNRKVNEDEKLENSRVKRDVEDRADIETIVAVRNNKIGTEKKYYFKTIERNVKGQKFRCKIGLTSAEVIFYYRCLLISNDITSEVLQETGQSDFFDIA